MDTAACYLEPLGLSYGSQIAAARKLLRIDQDTLAKRAGVGIATIKRMERSPGPITVSGKSISKVREALESFGVDLIDDHGRLGVILESIKLLNTAKKRRRLGK